MKKTISVLLLAVLMLLLCACGDKKSDITPVVMGISFTAELTYYNECYEANVKVGENGETDMEITSPDTIKGLELHFDGEDVTAKYAGLDYKTDFASLPEGACCMLLYRILKDACKEDVCVIFGGDEYYIQRDAADIGYKLFLGATGLPISAEDSENGFTVNFKNVTILN